MSQAAQTVSVSITDIAQTAKAALVAHGAEDAVAASVARAIARAEQTGNVVCGLYYLQSYCDQLGTGRVNGKNQMVATDLSETILRVDCKDGFPQVALECFGEQVCAKVMENGGIGSFVMARAHTLTSLGYFTERFAGMGLVAMGFTNAYAVVAPPGGSSPMIGTNPFAVSVPGVGGGVAFHMDQSTTAIAMGRVTQAAARGDTIPEGWLKDKDGNPTTDPGDLAKGGTMASVGGYKGWGLGVMVEIMASCLGGGTASRDQSPLKAPSGDPHGFSHTFLLMDPNRFGAQAALANVMALGGAVEQDGGRIPGWGRKSAADGPQSVEVPAALWSASVGLAGA